MQTNAIGPVATVRTVIRKLSVNKVASCRLWLLQLEESPGELQRQQCGQYQCELAWSTLGEGYLL